MEWFLFPLIIPNCYLCTTDTIYMMIASYIIICNELEWAEMHCAAAGLLRLASRVLAARRRQWQHIKAILCRRQIVPLNSLRLSSVLVIVLWLWCDVTNLYFLHGTTTLISVTLCHYTHPRPTFHFLVAKRMKPLTLQPCTKYINKLWHFELCQLIIY